MASSETLAPVDKQQARLKTAVEGGSSRGERVAQVVTSVRPYDGVDVELACGKDDECDSTLNNHECTEYKRRPEGGASQAAADKPPTSDAEVGTQEHGSSNTHTVWTSCTEQIMLLCTPESTRAQRRWQPLRDNREREDGGLHTTRACATYVCLVHSTALPQRRQ